MSAFVGLATAVSPWVTAAVTAAVGFAGTLLGAAVARRTSYEVAERNRRAAVDAWVRETRREIYDRFLAAAQRLLILCDPHKGDRDEGGSEEAAIREAHASLFEAYATVQTVAGLAVAEAARAYAYRLWELKEEFESRGVLDPQNSSTVSRTVRKGRHRVVNEMRIDLGLDEILNLGEPYNPFVGSELEDKYADRLAAAGADARWIRPGSSAPE